MKFSFPLFFTLGILIGISIPAFAGYYTTQNSQNNPQCPQGYLPDKLIGVLQTSDGWKPIYSCKLDDPSNLVYIQPSNSPTTTTNTPSNTTAVSP